MDNVLGVKLLRQQTEDVFGQLACTCDAFGVCCLTAVRLVVLPRSLQRRSISVSVLRLVLRTFWQAAEQNQASRHPEQTFVVAVPHTVQLLFGGLSWVS